MNKIVMTAFASAAALTLAACGSSDDASEDAMADNVEMPADEAMADAAEPVADTDLTAAEDAGADAGDTTAAATQDAEDSM
jgi:hypothetical protein